MTEAEWLACNDPQPMLEFLRGKASERKLRLLVCGYSRWAWPMLVDERSRKGIEVSERYADGTASEQDLRAAWAAAYSAAQELSLEQENEAAWAASRASQSLPASEAVQWVWIEGPLWLQVSQEHWRPAVVALIREIFGNPFRTVTIESTWLTPALKSIALSIYDDCRFADLPMFADTLEQAACANRDLLNHCRQRVEHVRGCWVIDSILGKN